MTTDGPNIRRLSKRFMALGTATCALAGAVLASPASGAVTVNGDPALYWSSLVSSTIAGPPILTSRSTAMAQLAIYEAANATTGRNYGSYLYAGSGGGDTRAAVAVAAHNVLAAVNASRASDYSAALTASLALIPDGAAKSEGIALGEAIAAATLALRSGDGSSAPFAYTPQAPGTPGAWQPTPGAFAPAVAPQWQNVNPWVMSSTDQFLAAPPPALDSVTYAIDFEEVKAIGSLNSLVRTGDQTNAAVVWASTAGVNPFLNVGIDLAQANGMSTTEAARMLALLALGNADALISVWDSKFHYDFWRPVTAIQQAGIDGNAATIADPNWATRITTPAYPSHSSGLSALAGNATTVLASFFGDDNDICIVGTAGQRCFDSFAESAEEAANSRIWGGIHFRFETEAGLRQGRGIANYTLRNALAPVPEPSTWAMLILGFGVVGAALRRRKRPKLQYLAV